MYVGSSYADGMAGAGLVVENPIAHDGSVGPYGECVPTGERVGHRVLVGVGGSDCCADRGSGGGVLVDAPLWGRFHEAGRVVPDCAGRRGLGGLAGAMRVGVADHCGKAVSDVVRCGGVGAAGR